MKSGKVVDFMILLQHTSIGLDTAAKSTEQQKLQLAPRLRPTCAGITFEGRVDFVMPEIWKSVVGHEGYYEVSNKGRVRTDLGAKKHSFHFQAGKILKQHKTNAYLHVWLCGPVKSLRAVHSVVLEAFIGPRPDGFVSRHLDGNRFNNVPENLAWGTHLQNIHDKQAHGTQTRGENHGPSKATESNVRGIRKMREAGATFQAIADKYHLHPQTVWQIVKRETWAHV